MEHVINANAVASRFLQRTSSSPTAFTGDSQSWQKWHSEFKEFARGLGEWLVNTMEVTELLTEDTEMQSLGELFPEPASVLMAILDRLLLGTAANIIQHAKLRKNGFEAWRCLCYKYQRSDRRGSKSLRRTILDFDFSGDFVNKLDQWEILISVYDRLDPTKKLEDTAKAIILEMNTSLEIPADLLKSTDVASYDRLKEFLLSQDHHHRPVLVHTGPGEPQQGTSAVSRVSDSDIAAPTIDLLQEEDDNERESTPHAKRLRTCLRWLATDKGIFNVYFICRSGQLPCNIVTQAKAWTFEDSPALRTRWYCHCGARYKTDWGVLIEIFKDGVPHYSLANLPPPSVRHPRIIGQGKVHARHGFRAVVRGHCLHGAHGRERLRCY